MVVEPTDLGMRVVVDHRYWGMVHRNEIFGTLERGSLDGTSRPCARTASSTSPSAPRATGKVEWVAERVLGTLIRRGGYLAVTDKSRPEEIYTFSGSARRCSSSPSGRCYKERKITLDADGSGWRGGIEARPAGSFGQRLRRACSGAQALSFFSR